MSYISREPNALSQRSRKEEQRAQAGVKPKNEICREIDKFIDFDHEDPPHSLRLVYIPSSLVVESHRR